MLVVIFGLLAYRKSPKCYTSFINLLMKLALLLIRVPF